MGWKNNLRWPFIAIAIVLVVIMAAGFFILRSRTFHRYVLATIVEKAAQSTGSRVTIGDFTFQLSGLRVDLYRITLYGAGPTSSAPLLTADHLSLGLRIVSILSRKISLNDIEVDHPVVHIMIGKQGRANIPHPSATSTKPLDVFELAARSARINQGEIYYNDARTPLDAALHDLQARVQFVPAKTAYDGTLAYRAGMIRFGEFNPVEHSLEAAFSVAPQGIDLSRLTVTSGASRISAQARLADYGNPLVTGVYQMALSGAQLRNILKNQTVPTGKILTQGSIRYQNAQRRPFLECVTIDGRMSSPELRLSAAQAQASILTVEAQYHLAGGNLTVSDMRAAILGGRLTAGALVQHVAAAPAFRVLATVSRVSLRAVNAALTSRPLKGVPIQGEISGKLAAEWRGSIAEAQAHSDIAINATTTPQRRAYGEAPDPVDGAIHLTYDGPRNLLTLSQSYLRTLHTEVKLDGTISANSKLAVNATSSDLREVDLLVLELRRAMAPGPVKSSLELLGMHGSASLTGQLQGSTRSPRFEGQFSASNLQVRDVQVRSARAQIAISPSSVTLSQGDVVTVKQGSIRFSVTAGLKNWSYSPSSPISVQLSAARVELGDLEQAANLHYPVTGALDANISVHGSQLNPAGQGTVRITKADFYNQPVQNLSIQFHGAGGAINSTVSVRTTAGNGSGSFTYYPRNEGYDTQLAAHNVRLGRLQAVESRGLGISGSLTLTARGRGTFKSLQLQASIAIPKLLFRQQQITAIKADLNVVNQHADFTLDSTISNASVKASGNVSLKPDYYANAKLDTQELRVGALLAGYLPSEAGELHAQAEVHASLSGPLKYPAHMQAQVEIPSLALSYQSLKLANTSPIRAAYVNGMLTLQPAEIKGAGTDLKLQGTVPIESSGLMKASVLGTVDLAVLQALNPEGSSSGQLKLEINAQGRRSHPEVRGDVRIVNAAFSSPSFPVGIEKLNGDLALDNHQVRIKQFTGMAGGGKLSAGGAVTLSPNGQFNIGLTATRVRFRYQESVRVVVNSNLSLAGTLQASTLTGRVVIDRVSFTPAFDLATFMTQMGGGPSAPPSQGFMSRLRLNVSVQSGRELGIESNTLSLQGTANLNLRGTAAEPVILGRATVTGGELYFLNARYQIQRGSIAFVNPVRTEPIVNILVTTTVAQYNLSVNLMGPADHLRTTYTSDPPLPSVDIINLLVRGQTTEQAAAGPSSPGLIGAESILAQGLAGQVSGQISKFTGLSSLTIDPTIGGATQNPGARLAIQKHVTKNLFITISTDVTSTQDDIIQVQYQFSRRLSVSVVRDQYGAYGLDIKAHKTF
ncbi:MAG: translocation/assembly module TamB domain-containing protein [Terriglobia bacterium]